MIENLVAAMAAPTYRPTRQTSTTLNVVVASIGQWSSMSARTNGRSQDRRKP